MKRLFAPILLLALAPGLSGCVAAALPLASGLLMGKDGLEAGRDGKDAGARTQAPPEADTRDSAMPADAPLAALSPADAPGIAEADLAGAQVASLAPFAEMPAPSGYAPPDDDAFAGLFAKVTAVAQADPFSDEKRKSAFLADPAGLSPERADCAFAQTAVLVDLDPGELVWMGGDTHLYLNHEDLIREQLSREPQGAPRLEIVRRPPSIFDYAIEDFAVHDYAPHGPIKAPVAV